MDNEDIYVEPELTDEITFLKGFTPTERNVLGVIVGFSLLWLGFWKLEI